MDEGTSRGWMVPRQRNNIAPVTISFKSGEESKSSSIEAKILLFRAQVNRLLITTILRTLHSACRNYTRAEFCIFFLFFFPERFLRTQVFTPPLLIQSYPFGNIQMGQVNERSLSTSRYHHWDPFIFFPCWTSLVVSREII